MPSIRALRRHLIAVFAAASLLACAGALAASAFRAIITGETVNTTKRTARLTFTAGGGRAARFRCALHLGGSPAAFKDCRSPVTYKHLQEETYTFDVYAVASSGVVSMGASRTFTVGSSLTGTYAGRTSQTRPKFPARVRVVVRQGQLRSSSSITWSARCTGQVPAFTDVTHFSGPVHKGVFTTQLTQVRHVKGNTENDSISLRITVDARRAKGTFTDTTQVLHGSATIAHCSSGTVRFAARAHAA